MSHRRGEIKSILSDILKNTLSNPAIFLHRPNDIWEIDRPFIVITTPKEISSKFTESPRVLQRRLYAVLETIIQGRNFAVELDRLGKDIEEVIVQNRLKLDFIKDINLVESEQEESPDGSRPAGSLKLVYEIEYLTAEYPRSHARELRAINGRFEKEK